MNERKKERERERKRKKEKVNKSWENYSHIIVKKGAKPGLLFVYFRSFHMTNIAQILLMIKA